MSPGSTSDPPRRLSDHRLGDYHARIISADAAVAQIPDGAVVEIARDQEPQLLQAALARRGLPSEAVAVVGDGNGWGTLRYKNLREPRPGAHALDVFIIGVSLPDENGYCSFGCALSNKKQAAGFATLVIAELLDTPRTRIRTFGENFIHVSEIDWFVKNPDTEVKSVVSGRFDEPDPSAKIIAQYVGGLVEDGDTIEIGTGLTTESLVRLGAFEGRRDLGIHTGRLAPGLLDLVRDGIATGRRKTINRGKTVFSNLSDEPEANLRLVHGNPNFEMRPEEYVNDPLVIAAHENFVAINGILSIDLLGQITSESMGSRHTGYPGGLPGFVLGATFSKNGRSITALRASAAGGTVSRIVAKFPEGTRVTIPYTLADIVVTEFGVAHLLGKSFKERAKSLIEIADPAFREALQAEVANLV